MEKKRHGGKDVLNILITAGGTSEKIDEVRRVTNSGTGRLGAQVAEAFAACGRSCRITYICSAGAVRPQARGITLREWIADDVQAVADAVRTALAETAYDIIVHSMAIGDYSVRAVSDAALVARAVAARISEAPQAAGRLCEDAVESVLLSPPGIQAAKISSDKENLIIVLEKAPKIIALYRGLAPSAVLVGFKLLADAEECELLAAGQGLLARNDCDFVFANDMRTVRSNRHEGLLIAKDGTYERALGKAEIALLIVRRTLEKLR